MPIVYDLKDAQVGLFYLRESRQTNGLHASNSLRIMTTGSTALSVVHMVVSGTSETDIELILAFKVAEVFSPPLERIAEALRSDPQASQREFQYKHCHH
jgi:hypothetical protein